MLALTTYMLLMSCDLNKNMSVKCYWDASVKYNSTFPLGLFTVNLCTDILRLEFSEGFCNFAIHELKSWMLCVCWLKYSTSYYKYNRCSKSSVAPGKLIYFFFHFSKSHTNRYILVVKTMLHSSFYVYMIYKNTGNLFLFL